MSDETPLSEEIRGQIECVPSDWTGAISMLDEWADRAADLEREVQELRALRVLVTEAARVTFANAQPDEYPLSVWSHQAPNGHPATLGATMESLHERGGGVTPEVIAYALEWLRVNEEADSSGE